LLADLQNDPSSGDGTTRARSVTLIAEMRITLRRPAESS
jgi:hypothetical protein